MSERAKTPPPTIKFRGAWSLNRNNNKVSWRVEFEQEQFTRLKCPELSAPARLREIHFLDARQPRQLIDAFADYSKILIIARFVRIAFEAQRLKIGQVILVTVFSWNDMVNLDRSLIC